MLGIENDGVMRGDRARGDKETVRKKGI